MGLPRATIVKSGSSCASSWAMFCVYSVAIVASRKGISLQPGRGVDCLVHTEHWTVKSEPRGWGLAQATPPAFSSGRRDAAHGTNRWRKKAQPVCFPKLKARAVTLS